MTPVGMKAVITRASTGKSRNLRQSSRTTEAMAPSWMAISKRYWNSICSSPKRRLARIKCPVEEIGRNSVKPSTTPRMIACSSVMAAFQAWTEWACRRDEGPQAELSSRSCHEARESRRGEVNDPRDEISSGEHDGRHQHYGEIEQPVGDHRFDSLLAESGTDSRLWP